MHYLETWEHYLTGMYHCEISKNKRKFENISASVSYGEYLTHSLGKSIAIFQQG